MSEFGKEKDNNKNSLHLDFKKTMIFGAVFCSVSFVLTSYDLEYLETISFPLKLFLHILKEFSQVGIASIAISAILNHTDLKKQNLQLRKELQEALGDFKRNFDYISHPEMIPLSDIENKKLDILIKKASIQKINRLSNLKDHKLYKSYISDIIRTYFDEISRMEAGYLNKSFYRTIEVTPNRLKNILQIKTTIQLTLFVPGKENDKKENFTFRQRFRTKKEANTLRIDACTLNAEPKDTEVEIIETESTTFPFACLKKIELKNDEDNTLLLISSYDFDLSQGLEFQEVYRVYDTCCDYKFICRIIGEDHTEWNLDINNTEVLYKKEHKSSCLERKKEVEESFHSIAIYTPKNQWISRGTTFNLIIRKVNNPNV